MNPSSDPREKLERVIHRTLRELPPRRAPLSLETRVFAEIARRAALPWWHKSFVHWPVPARAALLVVLIAIVKFVLMGGVWVAAGFDTGQLREAFAQPLGWMESGLAVVHAFTGFCDILVRNIPPLWLYGGLAFIATMYAALVGLGAAAYKTLYAQR